MQISKIAEQYRERDQSLYGSKVIRELLALLYHENSKADAIAARLQGESIGLFYSPYVTERANRPYKYYPGSKCIALNDFRNIGTPSEVFKCITGRRSVRDYEPEQSISLNELFHILYYSYGITYSGKVNDSIQIGYRNVPSAGALYPLELYVTLFRSHIPAGLYHYQEESNYLEEMKTGNHLDILKEIIFAEPWVNIKNAGGVIFITGIIERMAIKYGERGYRYMLQETGFVSYCISIICECLGLGSCMVGMYLDDKVNHYLEIDGTFETIQNVIVFGKKKE